MTVTTTPTLGLTTYLEMDFDAAVTRVTDALKGEGFGVLTEIDVQATLKKKLDVDFRAYKILGACNPPLAYAALTAAPEVGLLLPCNVTVAQPTDLNDQRIQVSIIDPLSMMSVIEHPQLASIADQAKARLDRVIATLNTAGA